MLVITDSTSFCNFAKLVELKQDGNISAVIVRGKIASDVGKGFEAYHSYKQAMFKLRAGGTAAAATVCFGPVGWLVGGGAAVALWFIESQKEEAKKRLDASPFSAQITIIGDKKYQVKNNTVDELTLQKG